jgi:hypothetical protein
MLFAGTATLCREISHWTHLILRYHSDYYAQNVPT